MKRKAVDTGVFPESAAFAIQLEDDRWIKDYDPDGCGGRGHVIVTRSVRSAKTFDTLNNAVNYCARPNRANDRPIIALTLTLVRVR